MINLFKPQEYKRIIIKHLQMFTGSKQTLFEKF